MSKCDGCPLDCLGQTSHPGFCAWWASGDPGLRRHVVNRSAIGHVERVPVEATSPPDRPPGLLARIATVGRAVIDHVVAGLPTVDEETAQARLAICRACPYLDQVAITCRKCTCHMDIKVYWAEQRCPVGKWEPVTSTP